MRSPKSPNEDHFASLRRQVRLLVLLNAAEDAGLVPIKILRLHSFAYLANVLAPVWDLPALDGKILKRRGGPFYPVLQRDLDRLVGLGMVLITGLDHVRDEDRRWRLEGSYCLNTEFSEAPLRVLGNFEAEAAFASFVRELAFALSALSDEDLDRAVSEDATYADPMVSFGNIVDFDEWKKTNYSANAAHRFEHLLPLGSDATPGEKLHLYVRHLHRRIHGGQ
jgi:hypothetical protein